jgi:hypothetical protein
MTNTEALNHLLRLAEKGETAYHTGYAESLKAYFADVNIEKYRKRFSRRVSPELFKQAGEITHPIQGSLGSMLEKPFAKVERSNWKPVVMVKDDKNEEQAREFEATALLPFGEKGLFPYIFERVRYWNIYDPNCFTVVDFAPFDHTKTKARPYPLEVTAEHAIDFKYDQADLLYLAYLQSEKKAVKIGGEQEVKRLTMYRPLQTVVLQELTDDEIAALPIKPAKGTTFEGGVQDGDLARPDVKVYQALIPIPHRCEKTPAARTGYIPNPKDNGGTKLSVFHAGLSYAKKLLKINEELDNACSLLAHPIRFRAVERCGGTGCIGGRLSSDNSVCQVCHGTGKKLSPTTASEELELELPDRPEEMLDPNKLMGYIHFPPEAGQFLVDQWDKFQEKAVRAVFNSELTTKNEVAQTARYHIISQEGVYDALWPYSNHISDFCAALSRIIAAFTNYPGGEAYPLIPSNLRFETVDDLFNELKAARDSGASPAACALINTRIMEILLQDDPEGLKRFRVEDYFDPFRGMSEAQALSAMASPMVPEADKVYYQNRARILSALVEKNQRFYDLERMKQRGMIDEAVKEIMAESEQARPALNFELNGNGRN